MRRLTGAIFTAAALLGACADSGPVVTERDWSAAELKPALYDYVERVSACETGVDMRRLVILDEGTFQPGARQIVVRYRYNYVCDGAPQAFSADDAAVFAKREDGAVKVFRSGREETAERKQNRALAAAE